MKTSTSVSCPYFYGHLLPFIVRSWKTCLHKNGCAQSVWRLGYWTGWWFQIFFIFTPFWGRFPIWLIFFQMGWKPPTSESMSPQAAVPPRSGNAWLCGAPTCALDTDEVASWRKEASRTVVLCGNFRANDGNVWQHQTPPNQTRILSAIISITTSHSWTEALGMDLHSYWFGAGWGLQRLGWPYFPALTIFWMSVGHSMFWGGW